MTKYSFLLPVILFLLLPACSEPERVSVFSLSEDAVFFDKDGGEKRMSFVTNNDWVVSTDVDWCHFKPTSGSARFLEDHSFFVSCDANSGLDRECDIIIRSDGQEKRIHLFQNHDHLVTEQFEYDLSIEEQMLAIPYHSDEDVRIEIGDSGKNWIRTRDTRASLVKDTVWLAISENRSASRSASVFLICDSKRDTVTIRQQAHVVPISDPGLLEYCLWYFDSNYDRLICADEAERVKELYYTKNLSSVGGLEYFVHLTSLWLVSDCLTSFDFSLFKELREIEYTGPISNPDFSANEDLESLGIYMATGGTICLKNLKKLSVLSCVNCTCELDLDGCTHLESLWISDFYKEKMLLKDLPSLQRLYIFDSPELKSMDVSQISTLTSVEIWRSSLEVLDLSSQTSLSRLQCMGNPNLKTIYLHHRPPTLILQDNHNPTSVIIVGN